MRYDARNREAIGFLHEAAQHKVWQAFEEMELIGEDALIVRGFATGEEQQSLWEQGRVTPGRIVTNAPAGWSFHNYGLAIDLAPVLLGIPLHQKWKLEWAAFWRYKRYAGIMTAMGWSWLYAQIGKDRPHFTYAPGLTIHDVIEGARPDIAKARQERIDALRLRLDMAARALSKRYGTKRRRRRLERFVDRMTERISEI